MYYEVLVIVLIHLVCLNFKCRFITHDDANTIQIPLRDTEFMTQKRKLFLLVKETTKLIFGSPAVCCPLVSVRAIAQPVSGNLQLSEGFLHVVSAVIATVDVQAALGKTSKIVPVCK